jgi:hypothetical protein
VRIEILSFQGCPNAGIASQRVDEAMDATCVSAEVRHVVVDTPELARQMRFLGSPTVRVNGADVEEGSERNTDYGLMCRMYREAKTVEGAPSAHVIAQAIRRGT